MFSFYVVPMCPIFPRLLRAGMWFKYLILTTEGHGGLYGRTPIYFQLPFLYWLPKIYGIGKRNVMQPNCMTFFLTNISSNIPQAGARLNNYEVIRSSSLLVELSGVGIRYLLSLAGSSA